MDTLLCLSHGAKKIRGLVAFSALSGTQLGPRREAGSSEWLLQAVGTQAGQCSAKGWFTFTRLWRQL